MGPAVVRLAKTKDSAELARLRWDFRAEDQPGTSRAEFLTACEAWLQGTLKSLRWVIAVAESEVNSLCGCMYLQCVESVPIPGRIRRGWGYVTNCYVASQQRGQGVGQKLLELLIDAARIRKLEFLVVWPSKEAVSFYQRAGFRRVSEVHAGPGDEPPLEMML